MTNHLTIHKGLEGVVVTDTQLSLVDGEKGHLIYRGFWAKELALKYTYEHVAYLLWYGRLPSEEELRTFREQMADARVLPDYLKAI
ncbi:MAG: citrate/2-methylcitrate synthase, partial [Bacillota bacterium]